MKIEFNTPYTKKPFIGEKMDPHSMVETAGYVQSQKRIEGMMACGQMIREVAQSQYDFLAEPPDFVPDPTRSRAYEMGDAFMETRYIRARGVKPSQTAPKAPEGASGQENAPE